MDTIDLNVVEPDALFACALELYRQGAFAQADLALSHLLERVPGHFDGWHLRGVLASRRGRPDQALEWLGRAIRLNSEVPAVHRHLGNALRELGRLEDALASYGTAIGYRNDFTEAFVNRGMTQLMRQHPAHALDDLNRAIDLGADDAQVHAYRASALIGLNRPLEAARNAAIAVARDPKNIDAHVSLAIALQLLARYPEAVASCDRAIAIDSGSALAHAVRALCLLDLQQPDAALQSCDRALALRADLAEACNTRGLVLGTMQRVEEALASFDQAIALRPELCEPYVNKGVLHLLGGDFEHGWELYGRRPCRAPYAAATQRLPLFDGTQDVAGKTVLVHAEQGLGDTIQFCRYANLLRGRGARVILAVQSSLCSLLHSLGEDIVIVGTNDVAPRADFRCALLSLPHAFSTRLQTIPSAVPYLRPDPVRVASWRRRLGGDGRLIGIRWQGSTGRADIGRSFPLQHFERIAAIPGIRLISLQKHSGTEQLARLPRSWQVEELGPDFESSDTDAFLDVAAVMECLDLVITSDTSIAHLSGALARPTWVALKKIPDWRWMLDRADSPWYPTMRLFRQSEAGNWQSVFELMVTALRESR